MIDKSKISVDHERQNKEKNIWWGDYPCRRVDTGRKLKRRLGYYFNSWKDYIMNGAESKRFNWEIEIIKKLDKKYKED